MNSPSWPPLSSNSPSLTEVEKGVSRDWVDKVLMNKQNSLSVDTDLGKWEEEGRKSSEIFYQKRTHNTSKVYPEKSPSKIPERRRHSLDNGLARTKYQQVAIDYSDDHEIATSDSSEPDNQGQLSMSKSSSLPSVIGSKLRKPSPKSTRSPEVRFIYSCSSFYPHNHIHASLLGEFKKGQEPNSCANSESVKWGSVFFAKDRETTNFCCRKAKTSRWEVRTALVSDFWLKYIDKPDYILLCIWPF
ncbi:hypothetical protein Sango_0678000 [Sesamum angolense]|uniref:Uncharacterized protein n=1 Tax=Sesamum angolense TaxID=2727404 RepID=A0AAE2C2V9_9LAMI|nr:hypothetical protein Sango_0678000 [Sesamum angolense]